MQNPVQNKKMSIKTDNFLKRKNNANRWNRTRIQNTFRYAMSDSSEAN